jgi:hypothetical protein
MSWMFCLFMLHLLPPLASQAQQSENLLANPGFEEISRGEPVGWVRSTDSKVQTCELGITHTDSHTGRTAYRIARVWGRDRPKAGILSDIAIPVEPQEEYVFSFWYRTRHIVELPLPLMAHVHVNRKRHETLQLKRTKVSRSPEWRQVYLLIDDLPQDAESVVVGVDVYVETQGELYVDDLAFRRASLEDIELLRRWRRQELKDPVGRAEKDEARATGFYGLAKDDDRWWLIDPEGRPTWNISTTARYPLAERCSEGLQAWADGRYPDRISYCRMLLDQIIAWGFNGIAAWHDDEMLDVIDQRHEAGEPYLPVFKALLLLRDVPVEFCAMDRDGNRKDGAHSYVDPYMPRWRAHATEKARAQIEPLKKKPWLVGWMVDNESDFLDLFRFVWAEHSAREFISDLKRTYGGIGELNEAWTSRYGRYRFASFDDILKQRPEPADWNDPLYADFIAFERKMIREYIEFTFALVKRLDPDHLVISNRINLIPMNGIHRSIDLWGRYDIIAVNMYPQNMLMGFSPGEIQVLEDLYEATGRPLLLTEWSVPAIDSGLYSTEDDRFGRRLDWSWPQAVSAQTERAEIYRACLRQLSSLEYVVGSHWYRTFDVDTKERRANRGILDTHHEPYLPLVNAMKAVHADIRERMGTE